MLKFLAAIFLLLPCNGYTVNHKPKSQGSCLNNTSGVCLTSGCVMAAARVLDAMDTSINPCDDFYNFACGRWIKKNVIPEDKSSIGAITKLTEDASVTVKSVLEEPIISSDTDSTIKAKNYYKECMNEGKLKEHGLKLMLKYLEDLGGWPILESNAGGKWNSSAVQIEDLLVLLRKESNDIPLITIGVMTDDKNPTAHVLYIDQPDLGMPNREYYLNGRDDITLMGYQTMIRDIAVAFGADLHAATNGAKFIVDMEVQLANITVPVEERRERQQMYNKMTIGDLRSNFTGVDFERLIRGTMQHVGVQLNDSEPVIVRAPSFFEKLGTLFARYSPRVLTNYVLSRQVIEKALYLPRKIRNIRLKYMEVLYGSVTETPRWQTCANHVKFRLPEVVGRLFVKEAFRNGSRADVLDMVNRLKTAFKDMIENLNWMENTTKQIAKEKVNQMLSRIGYSDIINNNSALNELYVNYTVFNDNPLKSLISFGRAAVIRQLLTLRKDVDKDRWYLSPATVNAFYELEANKITFPAAILQPPFYSFDQPAYLNYGGIGFVIGHEITHGFDHVGRLYDKTGALNNWWSVETAANFTARVQCLIDQYNNFTIKETGNVSIAGINAQDENIADNGGIRESFNAYREWVRSNRKGVEENSLPGMNYTPGQLFFLNSAQIWCEKIREQIKLDRLLTGSHAVNMFRVYGPLQNFDEFSKAWNCSTKSFMNPTNKCRIW